MTFFSICFLPEHFVYRRKVTGPQQKNAFYTVRIQDRHIVETKILEVSGNSKTVLSVIYPIGRIEF